MGCLNNSSAAPHASPPNVAQRLAGRTRKSQMGGHEILVGVGDSSFWQVPRPSPLQFLRVDATSSNKEDTSSASLVRKISCGVTAAFALSSQGSLLEWGTSVYGERLTPTAEVPQGDDASAAAESPPLDHPVAVMLPMSSSVGMKPPAIKLIACGAHFVVAALEVGGCVSWGGGRDARRALGRGGCGTCGRCSMSSSSTPAAHPLKQQQPSPSRSSKPDWVAEPLGSGGLEVNDLAAGDNHAIAVCGNGKAWAWGSGECGQLGWGPAPGGADVEGGSSVCVPVSVQVPPKVRAAACGRDHSAVLTDDGRVWTFGSSLHGQLGSGGVGEMSSRPAVVDALEGVGRMRMDGSFTGMAAVACGAWHTVALSTTGDVYAWGWARFGALGPSPSGNKPSRRTKAQAGRRGGSSGDEGEAGVRCSDIGTTIADGSERKAGVTKSMAAVEEGGEEGEVRPYPGLVDGVDGLLLDYHDEDQLVSVSCGARYTLALSNKKRAFVWGQIAPPTDDSGGGAGAGGKKAGPLCGSSRNSNRGSGSYSTPRELKPEELLLAAAAAAAPSAQLSPEGVDVTAQRCCSRDNAGGSNTFLDKTAGPGGEASVRQHDSGDSGSRWRISRAGCGPWYIVLGLEENRREDNKTGRGRSGELGSIESGLSDFCCLHRHIERLTDA